MTTFIPGISLETQAVVDWLLDKPVEYIAAHKELLEIARGKVHSVRSAIRIVESKHGQLWTAIRKVGYKRLSNDEKVGAVEGGVKKLHRAARRVERKANTVDYEALPELGKRRLDTARTQALFMKAVSEKRGAQKISDEIEASPEKLPDIRTLIGAFDRRAKKE